MSEWISVRDRLPRTPGRYLAYRCDEIFIAEFAKTWPQGPLQPMGFRDSGVTYWQHLPIKPKEPEYNPVTGEELEEGCFMMAHNTPDGLCDPITGCPGCAQERRRRTREGK
jgi:hypothetical protein